MTTQKNFFWFACKLFALFLLIWLVAGCSRSERWYDADKKNLSGMTQSVSGSIAISGQILSGYTAEQIATHSGSSSCWSIIDGKVYDFTDWVWKHPGGEKSILRICGKDGSMMFHEQHGAGKRMQDVFVKYLIGELK